MKPILGILLGEATGIGPEIVAKLCAGDKLMPYCRPILIGDIRVLSMGQKIAGVEFPVSVVDDVSQISWEGAIPIIDQKNFDPTNTNIKLGQINADSGKVTGDMLVTAVGLCQQGVINGFVFAPLNKAALKHGGYNFPDEHKLFTHYLNWNGLHGEMNMLNNLWTSRVTSHIPLKDIVMNLTIDKIIDAIRLANNTLVRAGFVKPRIAVAAINPHGGEDGTCGQGKNRNNCPSC